MRPSVLATIHEHSHKLDLPISWELNLNMFQVYKNAHLARSYIRVIPTHETTTSLALSCYYISSLRCTVNVNLKSRHIIRVMSRIM